MFFKKRKRRNYKKFIGSLLQALFFIVMAFPLIVWADSKIVINEIAWMGNKKSSSDEWIELKNLSNEDIDLSDWILECADGSLKNKDESDEDEEDKKKINLEGVIEAGGFYLLERTDDNSVEDIEADLIYTGSLSNNGEDLELKDNEGGKMDEVECEKDGWLAGNNDTKQTMARTEEGDWQNSKDAEGTPRKENEFIKYSEKVEITEFMPNPDGKDEDKEWIEILNNDDEEIDLSGWYFLNQSDKKFKLDGLEIKKDERLKIEIKDTSFSIKNSEGELKLVNPNGEIVDEVEYEDSAKKECSYSKRDNGKWEWTIFTTPGKENEFNHPPTFRVDIPDKIYEEIKTEFKLKKVKDKDKEELKYKWDFGDGHTSYLKETTHVYEDEGVYKIQVRVSDASVDVTKTFKVKVKDFPEYELKIIKLLPNPKGSDADKEKIWILNDEKKEINLKGWVIATGKSMSKLTNHYFKDDFKIDGKDIKEVEREDCPFSLLNKKGRVVLKSPNGEVVDKVKYEKEKIEEDEIYFLEGKEWFWELSGEIIESDLNDKKEAELEQSEMKEILTDEKYFQILEELFDSNRSAQTGSSKIVYFNNWLYLQSQGYFFEFIFPEDLVKRIQIDKVEN